jgi:hypothetical protein
LNSLVPPTCKSIRSEAVPDAVFVTFSRIPASTTPLVFHVGVMCSEGSVCVPVRELLIPNGTAVDPPSVLADRMYWFPSVPFVAAVVSPNWN